MFKILIFLVQLFSFIQATCRLTDISNIIGGPDYQVTNLISTHIDIKGNNFLAMAGALTFDATGLSEGFYYFYDYSTCSCAHISSVSGMNQGVSSVIYN